MALATRASTDAGKINSKSSVPLPGIELGPPKTVFEAAERGAVGFIVKKVERSLEFDINCRDKLQRTMLHWAAETNQVEVAEALMDYGIDPACTDCNGRTAIHLAAREGHAEILNTITATLSDKTKEMLVNQRDLFGITPVYLSLMRGEETRAAFEFLMRAGGRYNSNQATIFRTTAAGTPVDPAESAAAGLGSLSIGTAVVSDGRE